MIITRRHALIGASGLLAGCDRFGESESFRAITGSAEQANFHIQRALQDRMALAREFAPSERSPAFRANGTRRPPGEAYARHAATSFADWRVVVDGLVARPQTFSLGQIRAMPTRSQITRHDCVEGWSAIG